MTGDIHLTKLAQLLLGTRRFFVELNGQRSRWRIQKNCLPQGSVLSPVLLNIYANNQPVAPSTRSFVYADDLSIATQNGDISVIEATLTRALDSLSIYYSDNQLKANPTKTKARLFHLHNHEAGRKLAVTWNGTPLDHCENPVYLGVTLDRSLSFIQHFEKTRGKVRTQNNLLRKLTSSSWCTNASMLRTTTLALCYSAAEYACPVWERSSHSKKLDPVLNDCCRTITGCLNPTNLDLYYLVSVASSLEHLEQSEDSCHPCYDMQPPLTESPTAIRCRLWKEQRSSNHHYENLPLPSKDKLPPGTKKIE